MIIKCPCNENQLDALFILSLFRQSTSTCFGYICSPSSGGILYIYNNWYVMCFSVGCLLAGQQTANWKAQHIPIVVYIQYTSWWWSTSMPETCRGWLMKKTEDKQCIKLVFIRRMYRDARSTKHKTYHHMSNPSWGLSQFPTRVRMSI